MRSSSVPELHFPKDVWSLIDEALGLCMSHTHHDRVAEFATATSLHLLKQVHDAHPRALLTPAGAPVFLALMSASPSLALEWWKLRGEEAWSPTKDVPFPLAVVAENLVNAGMQRTANRWKSIKENPALRADFLACLKDGLRLNMPLREGDTIVKATPFEDQAKVVAYCASDCPVLGASEKTAAFKAEHGAWVVMRPEVLEGLRDQCDLLAQTPVWVNGNFVDYSRHPWKQQPLGSVLENHVRVNRGSTDTIVASALKTIAWMEERGASTENAWNHFTHDQIKGLKSWEKLHAFLKNYPRAWMATNTHGALCWQETLAGHPDWLGKMAASRDFQAALHQQGSTGAGVWDHFFEGVRQGRLEEQEGTSSEALTLQGLTQALQHAPLRLVSEEEPLLMRELPSTPSWWTALMDRTWPEAATCWAGQPDETQVTKAFPLVVGVLVGQGFNAKARDAAALNGALLAWKAKADPKSVTPETRAVLWAQHAVLQHAGLGDPLELPNAVLANWLLTPQARPDVAHMAWSRAALDAVPRPNVTKPHKTLEVFKALMRFGILEAWPEGQSPSRPKPRF